MTWRAVSKAAPCPICTKPDWCTRSDDGAARCMRITDPPAGWRTVKTCPDGGTVFRSEGEPARPSRIDKAQPQAAKGAPAYPTLDAAIMAATRSTGGEHVATWTYQRGDGSDAFHVGRFNQSDGSKQFRPVHRNGAGFALGDPPGLLPLYRLPHLSGQPRVFIVEGERCADEAAAIGLPATTSAHGSKSAAKTNWRTLAGRDCIILPDADDAGEHYAETVASILHRQGCTVRIVNLPGLEPGSGADVVDFIAERRADGKDDTAIRQEIEDLAALVQSWQPPADASGPVLVCMADVEPREVSWLWPQRVPLGRITLLVGRPGEGKSFLATDMAARVSAGRPWPDSSECLAGSVILISAEDDPADTIRPRLDAHLADVRKVHLLSMVRRIGEDGRPVEAMFTLADLPALEAALKRHADCKLIVIDPIGSFLGGGTDAHRDNEVRGVLAPVAKLAERYGPAVLVVAHRRKSAGSIADDLALGSRAFTGIARAVWHLSRDSEDKTRRLLLAGKCNLSPEGAGLAFRIEGQPPALFWEPNPVDLRADDALAAENGGNGDEQARTKREAAADWLRDALADGPVEAEAVNRQARANCVRERTLEQAKADVGVESHKVGFDKEVTRWYWCLPGAWDDRRAQPEAEGRKG